MFTASYMIMRMLDDFHVMDFHNMLQLGYWDATVIYIWKQVKNTSANIFDRKQLEEIKEFQILIVN